MTESVRSGSGGDRAASYESAAQLREALRRFDRRSDDVTRAHRLTSQRYELLLMIETGRDGTGRATLGELAQRLQLAPSSVTELVHRAEEADLVRREVDPRRRGVLFLRATREGRRRLRGAWADLGVERDRLAAILTELERDARPVGRRTARVT
jgi:DNA-binding MarR family transcriptional regulator